MKLSEKKDIFYIVFAVLFQAAAVLIIKFASIGIQDFKLSSIGLFMLALFCLFMQALFWQQVLKRYDLFWAYLWNTLLYPLLIGFGLLFFNETVNTSTIIGLIFIISGVIVLNIEKND